MKNYKQITRYQPKEWEESKEWRAKRLQFIWDIGRVFTNVYLDNRLCDEKHDMYEIDQISCGLASSMNGLTENVTKPIDKMSDCERLDLYVKLLNMKGLNDEFLKRWNMDRYIYLYENYSSEISDFVYDYYGCSLKSYLDGDY